MKVKVLKGCPRFSPTGVLTIRPPDGEIVNVDEVLGKAFVAKKYFSAPSDNKVLKPVDQLDPELIATRKRFEEVLGKKPNHNAKVGSMIKAIEAANPPQPTVSTAPQDLTPPAVPNTE